MRDPVRNLDLLWGAEMGQEGAVLFSIDVDSARVVDEYRMRCREFNCAVDADSSLLWIANYHGIHQSGRLLPSCDPQTREITCHGFPAVTGTVLPASRSSPSTAGSTWARIRTVPVQLRSG